MSALRKIARPMLAAPFVLAGLDAAIRPEPHRERAEKLYSLAKQLGFKAPSAELTDALTRGTGIAMTTCGLALARSRAPRICAALLGIMHVPLALANNPFWEHHGEEQRQDLLNLASAAGLIGGALIASSDREGKPSLAWRLNNWKDDVVASVDSTFSAAETKVKELGAQS
ncbi:putative membrane protein YphA (DoxX/SURF4 family) [Arcanobacterium pluranimalium]|uniref:DoxX family protein n=1 Tax=Arcanobacterium pluranimalium TaxID=108028 RepID=UPI00195DBCE0|nr:DoxX family protein [Arcanobacterium pluranimalium]MBM7825870.1 putative membrane protein YphA (DoxX/SURF4 family) [Arcanobacterium pluranimalium]